MGLKDLLKVAAPGSPWEKLPSPDRQSPALTNFLGRQAQINRDWHATQVAAPVPSALKPTPSATSPAPTAVPRPPPAVTQAAPSATGGRITLPTMYLNGAQPRQAPGASLVDIANYAKQHAVSLNGQRASSGALMDNDAARRFLMNNPNAARAAFAQFNTRPQYRGLNLPGAYHAPSQGANGAPAQPAARPALPHTNFLRAMPTATPGGYVPPAQAGQNAALSQVGVRTPAAAPTGPVRRMTYAAAGTGITPAQAEQEFSQLRGRGSSYNTINGQRVSPAAMNAAAGSFMQRFGPVPGRR